MLPLETLFLSRRSPNPRGFTLLELLACLLVISLLFSLLFPAVAKMWQRADSAKCMSNLRQLAVGAVGYSGDNNGKLVPACTQNADESYTTWRAHIAPYLDTVNNGKDKKTIFACPSDMKNRNVALSGNGLSPSSYGINFYTHTLQTTQYLHDYMNYTSGRGLTAIRHPSQMIFLSDLALIQNPSDPVNQWKDKQATGSYGYARYPKDAGFYGSDAWDIFPRHGGTSACVVFYDGHAAIVDLQKDIIDHPPGDPQCLYDND